MTTLNLKLGQTVETSGGVDGIVRYLGPIHVSEGQFVGIELPTATGKNDGSVRGERYFTCAPLHGLFIRDTSIVSILSEAAPAPAPPTPRAPTTTTRTTTLSKRQSVAAPSTTQPPSRGPIRKASVASTSSNSAAESSRTPFSRPESSRAEPSRPESSRPTPSASRPSLASSVNSNAGKASRDNNKQHAEDQERLREYAQRLQNKCQAQYTEIQELKDKDHEVDLEDALAEIESLRKRLEEQTLELDILRDEADLFTTEMSEDQKQEAGYYRLQHENDRMRQALITLKEMTEEREQDFKAHILGLEADVSQLEYYRQDNANLQERLSVSENLVDHLKQQLDAANEWEEMVEEIAEQDLVLEAQHLEQEEDMLAELEAKNSELAEQTRQITEQTSIIADQESLISKFRDLSSKTMTEAQVKDTTGRFNEVMDLNRQLRAATVLSTTREIESSLIWNETESKEFTRSESLQAYLTTERIAGKSDLLVNVLRSTCRHMSNGGRLDDAVSRLVCEDNRLWSAIRGLSLAEFANFGPTYQELISVEQADTLNFEEFAGSLERSTKTHEAILSSHQEVLAARPEGEFLSMATSLHARINYILYIYDLAHFVLQKMLVHFNEPLLRTLKALAQDHMYPEQPHDFEEAIKYDEKLASAAGTLAAFVCSLIEEPIPARELRVIKDSIDNLDDDQNYTFMFAHLSSLTIHLNAWADQHGPTPWAQKAKEVEAGRKKDDEAHRATVLKIHEREQVIATKELEIEHLMAKIKDATSKTEGLEALQEELTSRHDKIMDLQALNRSQMMEIEALRERLANADEHAPNDAGHAMETTTAPVEQPREEHDPFAHPSKLNTMLDALENENHWLRKRENNFAFQWNLRETLVDLATYKHIDKDTKKIYEGLYLDDDESDDYDPSSPVLEENPTYQIPNAHGAGRPKMSAIELSGISLGWEERAHSHKVALEQAEEDFVHLSMLGEDYDDLSFIAV
ncbi:dynein associated protein-domain-containing protein [Alternaria rosae]|uniref:dynein associated protein-domain-containing protein n=1 Tax=Alternaria rosae TaxID=1187941 RepID=UPI001E8DD6B7|nr:dynein associated protein-domain-containing protein [Alternaria rosae]KAH6870301.1 dynein associated protein-domain-containing protein [Alternaria rosae]